jgi:hypothetical protein
MVPDIRLDVHRIPNGNQRNKKKGKKNANAQRDISRLDLSRKDWHGRKRTQSWGRTTEEVNDLEKEKGGKRM